VRGAPVQHHPADANLSSSEARAKGLQELVAQTTVAHKDASLGAPTLSIGVAAFPEHGTTPEEVVKAPDLALSTAKANGRNRVVVAPVDLRAGTAPAPPPGGGVTVIVRGDRVRLALP
jgi:predicted signal transduction protein with EAL and GGDEF domain